MLIIFPKTHIKIVGPTMLVFKNSELIGDFAKMADEFGQEFSASDVESFLVE